MIAPGKRLVFLSISGIAEFFVDLDLGVGARKAKLVVRLLYYAPSQSLVFCHFRKEGLCAPNSRSLR